MLAGLGRIREATFAAITSLILSLLLRLPYFQPNANDSFLSNGTHAWSPTVILLSLDGFKPAYLESGHTPVLQALSQGRYFSQDYQSVGVLTSDYMLPASPSLTFPNHWTLQTGLQPSSHGIIANDFHRIREKNGRIGKNSSFYYTDPNRSWDASWWHGSPLWEYLVNKGLQTANLMWPGPPITHNNITSTYFQKYEKDWSVERRHDQIMQWLDLDTEKRPQFICAYAPDVDTATHNLGPDPQLVEVATALRRVDGYIHQILTSIAERNASSIVNVVIVSDHGMTFTSNEKLVYLDEILGRDLLGKIVTQDGWPNAGLRFRNSADEEEARRKLAAASEKMKREGRHGFDVVDRQELVKRWNWTMTDLVEKRVANLWVIPEVGWSVTTHQEMASFNFDYGPRGNHGYDATHPDMHAFFLARGPSIQATSAKHIESFRNVEIFNLIMHMLGIKEAKTDGKKNFWAKHIKNPRMG
ncbi:Phosphodiest-domain-containing protein [Meira miltonrushii]|uniref:Phosphodiest-domain-containing protein n=1 Tax=Meira miltonrushii TaxID=1280837 RepID=A0A316V2T6_9BASI|nr:Phosphodiest-domain-containing protein [Meira miltonrushii]PWN31772.1 Phosphodiest-domain-containing protein [Meira miltonrushii]